MIREALGLLVAGQGLSEAQAHAVMDEIMDEAVTPAQFGALITALRLKGETVAWTKTSLSLSLQSPFRNTVPQKGGSEGLRPPNPSRIFGSSGITYTVITPAYPGSEVLLTPAAVLTAFRSYGIS